MPVVVRSVTFISPTRTRPQNARVPHKFPTENTGKEETGAVPSVCLIPLATGKESSQDSSQIKLIGKEHANKQAEAGNKDEKESQPCSLACKNSENDARSSNCGHVVAVPRAESGKNEAAEG